MSQTGQRDDRPDSNAMIRLLRDREYLPDNDEWQMLRIRGLWNAYGTRFDFCRFYLQEESGAFLSVLDDGGILWADRLEEQHCSELADCIRMSGVTRLSMEKLLGRKLLHYFSDTETDCGSVMEKKIDFAPKTECSLTPVTDMAGYRKIYEILKANFSDMPLFESWYCDLSQRVRHEAVTALLYEQAGCLLLQNEKKRCFISAAAVFPEMQGRGIGRRMLQALETAAPILLGVYSRNKQTDRFYQKQGFYKAGDWMELRL